MAKGLYRGYSSYEYENNKTFKIADLELVKLDLMNHIFTRRGERVMMPTFGTRIPDMAFEPLDEITIDIVRNDLIEVFNFDPRVQLLDMQTVPDPDTNSLMVAVRLLYVELGMVDTLNLNIVFEGSVQ